MIPRQDYFQIAYLIPKGSDAELRARGLESFHRELAELIPNRRPMPLRPGMTSKSSMSGSIAYGAGTPTGCLHR